MSCPNNSFNMHNLILAGVQPFRISEALKRFKIPLNSLVVNSSGTKNVYILSFHIYLFLGQELTKFQSGFRIPATRTPSWLWVKVISSNIFAGLFSKINFQNLLCGNFLIIYFLNFLGIKNRLQLNDPRDRMNFEVHADTMSKTSSGIKAKYTL